MRKIALILFVSLLGCAATPEKDTEGYRAAETNLQLGVGYLKQGRLDDALEKLKKALQEKDDFADVHTALGLVYERVGEDRKADYHYQRAIELMPTDGGVYNNYGVFLCKKKQFTESEAYFLKAINATRYQTPQTAYENAGACAKQIPDQEKAEIYMRKALSIDPKLPNALYVMATIMFEQKRFLSARAYLQRLEEASTHTAASLWLGVRTERELGAKDAEQHYAKLLQQNFPDSIEFKSLLDSSQQGMAK